MKTLTKFTVSKMHFPVDGNRWYNVQIWHSRDGGNDWVYAGCGRHCTTPEACREYIAAQTPHESNVVGTEWEEGIKS